MTPTELLKMIEEVDPSDTGKMLELDAKVLLYVRPEETPLAYYTGQGEADPEGKAIAHMVHFKDRPRFSQSRDALKAIRPEGWLPNSGTSVDVPGVSFWFLREGKMIYAGRRKTEELAELHCVIQAIAYEKEQK